jgi:flagellar biosynthetic protein FliQ
MLLGTLVVGIGVGVLQAATQINEASIGFLAKLIVLAVTLAALGSWSMQNLVDYTHRTIGSIADVVR